MSEFDPTSVNLETADPRDVICYLTLGGNEYNGSFGARVSSIFVIGIAATLLTLFPVVASRTRYRIPIYVYLFARYFGAGVIIATAFIHLMQPAVESIGTNSCVGMTGRWATYSWAPAIMLTSAMMTFLVDFLAEQYVQRKYGFFHDHNAVENLITDAPGHPPGPSHNQLHSGDQDPAMHASIVASQHAKDLPPNSSSGSDPEKSAQDALTYDKATERSFRQQIAAFLILEFGVIFHSVIIGLNLGTAGDEFRTLYIVLVFHQAFEGLGIGARLSAIPFPKRYHHVPYILCVAYGLTTPLAIAIGLGLRTTYNAGSYTASLVSGTLDAISAGILIYTGFVELLARDFLFNPDLTRSRRRLAFMVASLYLGIALMSLLGKWA